MTGLCLPLDPGPACKRSIRVSGWWGLGTGATPSTQGCRTGWGAYKPHISRPLPTPLDSDSGGGTRSHSTAHSSQICCLRSPGRAQPWKVTARLGALSLSAPVFCLSPAQLGGGPRLNLHPPGTCVRRAPVRCVSNGVRRALVGIILSSPFFMNEKLVFTKKIRHKSVTILPSKCNDS